MIINRPEKQIQTFILNNNGHIEFWPSYELAQQAVDKLPEDTDLEKVQIIPMHLHKDIHFTESMTFDDLDWWKVAEIDELFRFPIRKSKTFADNCDDIIVSMITIPTGMINPTRFVCEKELILIGNGPVPSKGLFDFTLSKSKMYRIDWHLSTQHPVKVEGNDGLFARIVIKVTVTNKEQPVNSAFKNLTDVRAYIPKVNTPDYNVVERMNEALKNINKDASESSVGDLSSHHLSNLKDATKSSGMRIKHENIVESKPE